MEELEVVKAVNAELSRSEAFMNTRISYERALAYDYYYGREFGNEVDGRSRVVSADVAQAVDGAVPAIVEIFVSGDKAVEFTPRGAEDIDASEQATLSANYVFFTQNNGYALAHDFIKDGLLQKTGVFKWKWDTSQTIQEKRYQGLDEMTLGVLAKNPDVEIVEHSAYDNPMAQGASMISPPGVQVPGQLPQLHDVTVRIKKEAGKVKIVVPAPEEIQISPDSMTLDVYDMPFIAHTPLLTKSDLVEMGISEKVIATLPKGDRDTLNELERIARKDRTDSAASILDEQTQDDEHYRYNECYIRLDEDGDGIAELRKICIVGDVILHDEPTDHIPMAIWTPKVMPHEVVGISLADDVMDIQLLKSTLWRQSLDNMYLTNAPRLFGTGEINMDDVLTVKPGGYIRGEHGATLTPIVVPFTAAGAFQMLEYSDQEKDARVGFSALGPGMDPSSINKTATFVREMTNQTNARAKMIARNAAEFGFKPLFKGILYLLSKHQTQALMVRLNNKFVPVDPETWNKEYDMSCNVGLGVGNKEQQLMHLQALGQDLAMIGQSPHGRMVTEENVYNYFEKKANLAGFKDASVFLTKPVDQNGQPIPPPPPPKPPQVQVAEIKAQTDAQALQIKSQADQQQSQVQLQADVHKFQAQAQLDQVQADQQLVLEREKLAAQMQFEREKMAADFQFQMAVEQLKIQSQERIAALNAHASVEAAKNKPQGARPN